MYSFKALSVCDVWTNRGERALVGGEGGVPPAVLLPADNLFLRTTTGNLLAALGNDEVFIASMRRSSTMTIMAASRARQQGSKPASD